MQVEDVLAADVVTHLPCGFQEGLRFNIADGAADLGDDHVGLFAVCVGIAHSDDAGFDLVGDVRDDLDGLAEEFAAALLGDDRGIDLAGGDVAAGGEIAVEEALVVTEVQVGFCAVFGDEDLAVLEGVHGARIHVEVGIELLHSHFQTTRGEQAAERSRS